MATWLGAVKGGRPARHSYATTPREYMSVDGVRALPEACSGLTYCAVPSTVPVMVMREPSRARAMPKSVTLMIPVSVTRMLPGLMSRWMMPDRCAVCSARAVWPITSRVTSGLSVPLRASIAASGSPGTSSITR